MARLNSIKSFRGTTKTPDGTLTCGKCRGVIAKGDSYKWWANRAPGQMSSFKQIRCDKPECHPTLAERTPGRLGQWYALEEGFNRLLGECATVDAVEEAAQSIGSDLEDFASEYIESADNMEEGFGHATSQSDDLRERGKNIEEVGQDIQNIDFSEWYREDGQEDADEDDEDDEGYNEAEAVEQAVEAVNELLGNVEV